MPKGTNLYNKYMKIPKDWIAEEFTAKGGEISTLANIAFPPNIENLPSDLRLVPSEYRVDQEFPMWVRYSPKDGWSFSNLDNSISTGNFPESFDPKITLFAMTFGSSRTKILFAGQLSSAPPIKSSAEISKAPGWLIPVCSLKGSRFKKSYTAKSPLLHCSLKQVITTTPLRAFVAKTPFLANFQKGDESVVFWVSSVKEAESISIDSLGNWKNMKNCKTITPSESAKLELVNVNSKILTSFANAKYKEESQIQIAIRKKGESFEVQKAVRFTSLEPLFLQQNM